MDADVRFSKHGNAGYTAIGRKMMHVNMQERGTCDFDAFSEGTLDMRQVVEPRPLNDIDDKMRAREGLTIANAQIVFSVLLLRHARAADGIMLFFRLGGA